MHDYSVNDPKGWCGDPKRGAALGRPTIHDAPKEFEGRILISDIRLRSDYDRNGTYFGFVPGTKLYWYRSDDGAIDAMVRKRTRAEVRDHVLNIYPKAKVRK
jgi:hypothetical protein